MTEQEIYNKLVELKQKSRNNWYKSDFDLWEHNKHLLTADVPNITVDSKWVKPKAKSDWAKQHQKRDGLQKNRNRRNCKSL